MNIQCSLPNSNQYAQRSDDINLISDGECKQISPERFLCFTISNRKCPFKFLTYTFFIFIFFLIYGYLQELIFQLKGFKPYGLYLTLIQFLFYVFFSFCERCVTNERQRKIPMNLYALLAVLTVATMGLSNASVGYLNYPTQVVFKCCKLVPVLIGGILIQGKIYGLTDFLAAFLMSIGLILFTLADSKISPNFNLIGVVLVSSALVADATIGNLQEKVLKQYLAANSEMVFYSYGIGFFYILLLLTCLGQLRSAYEFCSQYPVETYGYGFLFSLTGYCGVNLVLSLVRFYGAFTAVTVTTCRKALTIVISFIVFSKPFTIQYLWSGLIVVCGIYLSLHNKVQTRHLNMLSGVLCKCFDCLSFIRVKRNRRNSPYLSV